MKQPDVLLPNGTRVRTHAPLELPDDALVVEPCHLAARRAGAPGVIAGTAPAHGGDVYLVRHENGAVGAYCYSEFEQEEPAGGDGDPNPMFYAA